MSVKAILISGLLHLRGHYSSALFGKCISTSKNFRDNSISDRELEFWSLVHRPLSSFCVVSAIIL